MRLETFVEEYNDMLKFGGDNFTIFVNPTPKELREIVHENDIGEPSNEIRFIVDFKDEKLYAFGVDLMHYIASSKLGIEYNYTSYNRDERHFFGIGELKNGKLTTELKKNKMFSSRLKKSKLSRFFN